MKNAILVVVLLLIVAAVVLYLYRAKRRGQTCIGCPCAKDCKGSCHVTDKVDDHSESNK